MIDVVGFLSAIGERFIDHPWVYLTMPFVAAAIGYGTKLAAIRMMFEPLEFVGVGRFGWQGIIPRRAAKMAAIAVETMTANLLDTARHHLAAGPRADGGRDRGAAPGGHRGDHAGGHA